MKHIKLSDINKTSEERGMFAIPKNSTAPNSPSLNLFIPISHNHVVIQTLFDLDSARANTFHQFWSGFLSPCCDWRDPKLIILIINIA